ncbi:peptidylprolyl isomerase [Altericista sp. CCNU0014]|uniref:foldase protein PrsA n=1 Tax=Altericista sp. CCNU0014 TaxID=3082949 RepID=UPI00384B4C9C
MTEQLAISAEEVLHHVKLSGQLPALKEAIAIRRIIQTTAADRGIEVTPEEIQTSADEFRKANNLQRAEDTLAWLQQRELAVEDFEAMIRFSVLQSKLAKHLFEDRVEAYFASNQLDYMAVALYEVVLEDEDIALELFYGLKEGEITFFEVAQQYIQDAELRRRGGYRGILKRTELSAEISSTVFASTPPQLLKPILAADGIHLIYVEEILVPNLSEQMQNTILSDLFSKWLKRELSKYEK